MKVCPECMSEYVDQVNQCDDCQVPLVAESEARARRQEQAQSMAATTRFVPAGMADNPFDAEAFVAAVDARNIPVLSRARRTSAVDVLVTSGSSAFWEIVVPEDRVEEARQAIEERRKDLAAGQESAERAAEEEASATEGHEVVGESESEPLAAAWVKVLAEAGIPALLRAQSDVEADTTEEPGAARTLVLVPKEELDRARALLREQAQK